MTSPIESFLRRDREVKIDHSEGDRVWFYIAFISFIVAGVLVANLFLPKAHAQEMMSYKDVHTEKEACAYLHEHPGSITNVSYCSY